MFKDHFSGHSQEYAQYRPGYPPALFDYLAGVSPGTALAWDAATGTGKAALGLALHFEKVHASDASAEQIANAARHDRICYFVEPAESSSLAAASVDLIAVAQALHWFDLDRFYAEVRRVLKRDGVVAAWTYATCAIDRDVDNVVAWFYHEVVGPYWPEERKLVEDEYKTLYFPLERLSAPAFDMRETWDMQQFIAYLGTWSATQRFVKSERHDYREVIGPRLRQVWGHPEELREIRWPLHLLVGCSRE